MNIGMFKNVVLDMDEIPPRLISCRDWCGAKSDVFEHKWLRRNQ